MICDLCGHNLRVSDWPWCPHESGAYIQGPAPGAHESEKCVVYVSAKEGGKVQYAARADVPVPERLQKRGYERVEISPSQMGSFEKKHGVANERRHFNKGNGF